MGDVTIYSVPKDRPLWGSSGIVRVENMRPKTQLTTYEVSLEDLKKMFAEKLGVKPANISISYDVNCSDNLSKLEITVTTPLVSA